MTYSEAVAELIKAARRVDDYSELQAAADRVEQMTPPKICECPDVLRNRSHVTNVYRLGNAHDR